METNRPNGCQGQRNRLRANVDELDAERLVKFSETAEGKLLVSLFGQLGDPREVVDALVEIVGTAPDQLPDRKTVGQDVYEPVTAINQVNDQVQDQLLKAFGLRS